MEQLAIGSQRVSDIDVGLANFERDGFPIIGKGVSEQRSHEIRGYDTHRIDKMSSRDLKFDFIRPETFTLHLCLR